MTIVVFAQEPYPAADYDGRWAALGLLILVVVAVWFVAVMLATRARPAPAAVPQHAPAMPYDPRVEIAAVEALVRSGAIGPRRAHTELSAIVRRFVSERTGIPADRMHLGDLHRAGVPLVPQLLAVFYPAQFAQDSGGDPLAAVAMARSVVDAWAAGRPGDIHVSSAVAS